ncbi:hypothetical protein Fcan01_25561 [Folsomia candida]|uniref:DUF4806 domain-containing protein n=1 Tax=Folsomia candida TaxID=158441 RepID=A0A226D684_FOLCA|nr:hypothetical protein Fcan01_25561 [Folsomia candida]
MARKNNADLTWNANKENARNPKFCLHSIFLSHKIDCNGEKFVEIAPTIWLEKEEKFVLWPPASKLKSFSKKGNILGKYVACEKVKIAEDTSNLKSASENHLEGRKQKHNRELSHPNVSSSSSEDEEENSILVLPPPMNDEGSTEVQLSTQINDNIPSINLPEVVNLEGEDIDVLLATSADINDLKKLIEGKSLLSYNTRIIKILERQNAEILEIRATLHNIRISNDGEVEADFSSIPHHHLETREHLEQTENWLKLADTNRDLLIEYLRIKGGDTVEKNTKKAFKKLVSPELARQINYTGKGGKIALKPLGIFSAVIESVRKNYPAATDNIIEKAAKDFFRFIKV